MSSHTSFGYNSLPGNYVYGSSTSPATSSSICCSSTFGYNSLAGDYNNDSPAPAAPFDSVQYNDSGDFGGDSAFTYDQSTATLAVTNIKPTTITDDVNSVGTSGQYLSSTGTGVDWVTPPSLPVPGGVSTNIQFNNAGSFGGSANFVRNLTTGDVNINANLGVGSLTTPTDRLVVTGANATVRVKSTTANVSNLVLEDSTAGGVKQLQMYVNIDTADFLSIRQGVGFRNFRFNTGEATSCISVGTTGAQAIGGLMCSNALSNRKIILFSASNDEHRNHSIGVNANTMRFQIPFHTEDRFAWFAGTSTGTSNELMRLTGTGNLAIGTTSANAPLQLSNALVNRKIVLYESVNNDHQFFGLGINTSTFRFQIDNTANRYAWFAGVNASSSNEVMRLTGTGELTVGRNATSLITISKGTGTTASTSYQGYLKVGGAEYGAAPGTRRMIGFGYNTGANNQPAYIGFEERVTSGDSNGDLVFGTRTLTTGDVVPTERMRILANGNVCIGVGTTTYALDVIGNCLFGTVTCGGATFNNSLNALTFSNTSTVRNGNNGFNLSSNAGTAVIMSTFAQPYPFNLANGVSRAFYNYATYILTITAGNSSSFAGFGRWQFNAQVPVVSGTSGAMALQSASVIGGPYTTVAYTEQYNTFVLKLLYAVNVTTTTYFRLVSIGSIHTVNMNNLDCFYCVDCLG